MRCDPDASCRASEHRGREGPLTTHGVGSPTLTAVHPEICQILKGGIDSLGVNDFGRPWPAPRGDVIAAALAQHDHDLCIRAARQAREIVQSQDRAPNITALFEKKLRDLAEVRNAVRGALTDAGKGVPCL